MFDVLLYFVLNFAGFFVFLAIWNWIPKPKPFDYTTIPGLKLSVSTAEEIPNLVALPGDRPDTTFRGHFDDVIKYSNLRQFLDFLFLTYGPLSSFWWSTRYVAVVSNEKFLSELKKFSANLTAVSPFSVGHYLHGGNKYCTSVNYGTLRWQTKTTKGVETLDENLTESEQDRLLWNLDLDSSTDGAEQSTTSLQLNQSTVQYNRDRKSLSRPLLVVFEEEIWVDAHPIPRFVPIIIHTEEIIRDWPEEELFEKFCEKLDWLPGFSSLNEFL